MKRTIIVYDMKSKDGKTVVKNFIETLPTEWNEERTAKYIKTYLSHMPGVINIRCNNISVLALL